MRVRSLLLLWVALFLIHGLCYAYNFVVIARYTAPDDDWFLRLLQVSSQGETSYITGDIYPVDFHEDMVINWDDDYIVLDSIGPVSLYK
ncbi:MAG: hypothetical protein P8123_10960, partial [bacterium]